MLSYVSDVLGRLESRQPALSREEMFAELRHLGFDDFGEILLEMPHPRFPRLSAVLPRMASEQVQTSWTGAHGQVLLRQSSSFVRSLVFNYARFSPTPLAESDVLDFGCGYARLARLMYYFVPESRLWGVDSWDRSIAECRAGGFGPQFLQSDVLPTTLPSDPQRFHLAYAFSVLTHLSERATRLVLDTVRRRMHPGGIFCVTIRPVEYWVFAKGKSAPDEVARLERDHREKGFAYAAHGADPLAADVHYGDTSMTLDWLRAAAPGWTLEGIDRSSGDSLQIYVFLRAA